MRLRSHAAGTATAIVLLISLLAGCEQTAATQAEAGAQSLPTVHVPIGNRDFTLEVAATEEQHNIGLMYRESMPADHGMIFVFEEPEPLSFWMKNTLIPLDIAYLDTRGRVVQIRTMKPKDLTGVPSVYPAKYAVELNAGIASAIGLKIGDVIQLPDILSSPERAVAALSGNPATAPASAPATQPVP